MPLKIAILGGGRFSVMIAREFIRCGHKIVGFSFPAWYADHAKRPVEDFTAANHEIKLFRDLDELATQDLDFILATEYGNIIPERIFSLPKHGSYNVHNALLPRYRGRHPLVWALIRGETEVGVTIHDITPELDAGDIVYQTSIPVSLEDTVASLGERLNALVRDTICGTFNAIAEGSAQFLKQDPTKATFFGKRTPEMGFIKWNKPSLEVYNLVRALTKPYPGARTLHQGDMHLVWQVRRCDYKAPVGAPAGTVLSCTDSIVKVATADGAVEIIDRFIPGLKRGDLLTSPGDPF